MFMSLPILQQDLAATTASRASMLSVSDSGFNTSGVHSQPRQSARKKRSESTIQNEDEVEQFINPKRMSNEEDEKQTLGTGSETGTSYPEDLESDDYTRRATTV